MTHSRNFCAKTLQDNQIYQRQNNGLNRADHDDNAFLIHEYATISIDGINQTGLLKKLNKSQ